MTPINSTIVNSKISTNKQPITEKIKVSKSQADSSKVTEKPKKRTIGQFLDESIQTIKEDFGELKYAFKDSTTSKKKTKTISKNDTTKKSNLGTNNITRKDEFGTNTKISYNLNDLNNLKANFNALMGKAYTVENEISKAIHFFSIANETLKADTIYDEREAITLLYLMENDLNMQNFKLFEFHKAKLPISEKYCLRDSVLITQFTANYTKILGDYYFNIQDQKKALDIYRLAIKRYEIQFGFHIDEYYAQTDPSIRSKLTPSL